MSDETRRPINTHSALDQIKDKELVHWLLSYFESRRERTPNRGDVDIVCLGDDTSFRMLSAFAFGVTFVQQDDSPRFSSTLIVLSNTHEAETAEKAVTAHVQSLLLHYSSETTPEHAEHTIRSCIVFTHAASLGNSDLLLEVQSAESNSAVIIYNAANHGIKQSPAQKPQGEWVRQTADLSKKAKALANQKSLYIQLLTGRHAPSAKEEVELLMSLPVVIIGATENQLRAAQEAELMKGWLLQSADGRVEDALLEIGNSQLPPKSKSLARAFCLNTAQQHIRAFSQVTPILDEILRNQTPEQAVMVAKLAVDAGESQIAESILSKISIQDIVHVEDLLLVHQLAWRLGDERIVAHTQTRILQLFPDTGLKEIVDARLEFGLLDGLNTTVRQGFESAEIIPDWALYAVIMSDTFSSSTPDVTTALREVSSLLPHWAERSVFDCARFASARARKELKHAARALASAEMTEAAVVDEHAAREGVSNSTVVSAQARAIIWYSAVIEALEARTLENTHWSKSAEIAMETMSELLLQVESITNESPELDVLLRACNYALEYVAKNPLDYSYRKRLSESLSVDDSGANGLTILMLIATRITSSNIRTQRSINKRTNGEELKKSTFFDALRMYIDSKNHSNNQYRLTPDPLDHLRLPASPEALLRAGMLIMEHMAWRFISEETDTKAMFLMLKFCIDLSDASPEEVSPTRLIRLAASGFADAGAHQDARDLAEEVLALLKPDAGAYAKWNAWATYSDIHHRLGNTREVLLGWICAHFQKDITATHEDMFPFAALSARVFRDLDMTDAASHQAAYARQLLIEADLLEENINQISDLELSIEMKTLAGMGPGGTSEQNLSSFAQKLATQVHSALSQGSNVLVSAILLAQVIRQFRISGINPPLGSVAALDDAIQVLGDPLASKLRVFAATSPSIDSIKHFAWGIPKVRHSKSLGEDVKIIALVAERALTTAVQEQSLMSALVAIELMADHTMELPGRLAYSDSGTSSAESNSVFKVLSTPLAVASFASRLSERLVEVCALGQAEDGKLVRVSAFAGELSGPLVEAVDVFDYKKLEKWREHYPMSYPSDPDKISDINTLEHRMKGLGFSGTTHGEMVIVRGSSVSDIPANLMVREGQLLGTLAPVSTVPSLTWLEAAMSQGNRAAARRVAWLLPPNDSGSSPLSILYAQIQKTLRSHAFDVVSDSQPSDMSESKIAVIAGHGSVWGSEKYFKQLSGEGISGLRGADVAGVVRGTDVVVLLACSAGRLDGDAFSVRSIGLPHQLLRQGCRAVVASPWPIKFPLAGKWLEWFLECMDIGFSVSESNYYANCQLREKELRVSDFLAMHVIGDPFVKIHP